MPGQGTAKPPIETFVNQDAHNDDSSNGFEHLQFPCFDNSNSLFTLDGGKSFEEIFDGFTAFEIVNEVLQGNSSANENGRPTHDFRIRVDDSFDFFAFHQCQYIRGRFSFEASDRNSSQIPKASQAAVAAR